MVMKVAKEDISKILAKADITVNSVALNKEKIKGCFYTVLGTCQKTFVTGCMYEIDRILLY